MRRWRENVPSQNVRWAAPLLRWKVERALGREKKCSRPREKRKDKRRGGEEACDRRELAFSTPRLSGWLNVAGPMVERLR